MRAFDEYIDYFALGTVGLLSLLFALYVLWPATIGALLEWATSESTALVVFIPVALVLGLVFHAASFRMVKRVLHKRILAGLSPKYQGLFRLVDEFRGDDYRRCMVYGPGSEKLALAGDAFDWCRFLIFQFGTPATRSYHMVYLHGYRIAYGCLLPLLIAVAAGTTGLFIGNGCDVAVCASGLALAGFLLLASFWTAERMLKVMWRYVAYSAEILLRTGIAKPAN